MQLSPQLIEVNKNLDKKDTQHLLDIINYSQDDYNPEVIPVIVELLINRGVKIDEITKAKDNYDKIIKNRKVSHTQGRPTKTSRFLIWILWLIGLSMASFLFKAVQKAVLNNIIISQQP